MTAPIDPRFAAEVARTLRDEKGARALYARLAASGRLAKNSRDPELARVLHVLADEGDALERAVRDLMRDLGAAGRERSVFRWFSARLLALFARSGMLLLVLRLSLESEEVLARRYAGFAHWLAAGGRIPAARACDALAQKKVARAHALRAWVRR